MSVRVVKSLCVVLAVFLLFAAAFGCSAYGGAQLTAPTVDGSVAFTYGENIRFDANPDRGFRMESALTLGSGTSYPGGSETAKAELDKQLSLYAPDSPSVTLLYVYLDEYKDISLDDTAFEQLYNHLRYIRNKNLRAIIRFAYGVNGDNAPVDDVIIRHINSIGNWINKNKSLWADTVFSVQLGFIAGGEGAREDMGGVYSAMLNALPEGSFTQARSVSYKNTIDISPLLSRVGYYDAYLNGKEIELSAGGGKPHKKPFKQMVDQSVYTLNDGAMQRDAADVDALSFISQLKLRSLATLSLAQNYNEKDGVEGALEKFKSILITPDDLNELNAPYNPNYFRSDDGRAIERSVYDYLRDHLGYHLAATDYSVTHKSAGNKTTSTLNFSLVNYGMGAPLSINKLKIVVTNKATKKTREYDVPFAASELTTYRKKSFSIDFSSKLDDQYIIGIKMFYDRRSGNDLFVRFANADYIGGVNYVSGTPADLN